MRVRLSLVAGKKIQVSDLRALIEAEAVSIEELSVSVGRSFHSLLAFTQGRVPKGADPWPTEVKMIGRSRLYCRSECTAWLDRWSPTGRKG